jgi:hypothetical protein
MLTKARGRRHSRRAAKGVSMTDNTELQRLIRLNRLGRQIAAGLPVGLDQELHGYLREPPARASRHMSKPTSSKAVLRAQLEAALVNYQGPVTLCPPAPPPEPDSGAELDLTGANSSRACHPITSSSPPIE